MITTLIVLNLLHWAADYTHLSTAWMLNAKRLGKPILPILAHAGVHATLMGFAMLVLHGATLALQLALFQLITHFLIDLWKGRMNGWFPKLQSPANKWHWIVFGADQYLHQLVLIAMAYFACA